MSRPSLIVGSAALMLAAVVFVLWLAGTGESSLPEGLSSERMGEAESAAMSGDLAGVDSLASLTSAGAERSAVVGEGEFDPEIQKALCGFTGRVVDFRNQPVEDCGVRIFRMAMDSVIRPGVSLMGDAMTDVDYVAGEDQTAADGVFRITGVWPRGIYLLYGGIGTDNPTHVIVRETPGPGEIVDLGDIVLNNGAVLTGVVVDEDSEPVPGALVRGVDLPGQFLGMVPIERFDPEGAVMIREDDSPVQVIAMPPWVNRVIEDLPIPKTTTDLEGRFRLVGLTPGANLMAVTKLGFLSHVNPRLVLKAGEERDLGRIRMREGEQLFGQVLDTSGEPVVGAEVVAGPTTAIAPVDFGSFVGPSDGEGRFQANGFPRGQVTVAARRSPGQHWVLAEPQSIDTDVIVQLPGAYDLIVGVVSSLGETIESPAFRLLPAESRDGATEMAILGFVRAVDLDGKVDLLDDGRYQISDLSEGQYTLLVSSPGHAVAMVGVALQSDEEVTVEMGAQTHYSVRVTDLEGKPIRSVQIYATGQGPSEVTEIPLHCGYTNADGRLAIDEVQGERIRLTASHPAYGMAHARGELGSGEIAIVLSPPGSVEGELTEDGRPPEPGKWSVIAIESGRRVSGAMEDVPQFAVPDLQGVFHFADLQPGEFTLQPVQSMDLLTSPGSIYTFAMMMMMEGEAPSMEVEVVSGATLRVHMETSRNDIVDGPAARVTGVVMVNGRPATGTSAQVFGQGQRKAAKVDETGMFDLGYIREGQAQLAILDLESGDMFSGGPPNLWSEQLEIVANEDQHLTIDLQTSSLSGSVVNPDGDPIPLASVRLNGQVLRDQSASGTEPTSIDFRTQTDIQGRFEFKKLPAGEYSVSVEANDSGQRMSRSGITVVGSLPITGLRLTTSQTYTVRGRVDLSAFGEEKPRVFLVTFSQGSVPERPGAFFFGPGGTSGVRGSDSAGSVEDDGSFEVDNLLPGSYSVRLYSRRGAPLDHEGLIVVGSSDMEGVVLRPVPKD